MRFLCVFHSKSCPTDGECRREYFIAVPFEVPEARLEAGMVDFRDLGYEDVYPNVERLDDLIGRGLTESELFFQFVPAPALPQSPEGGRAVTRAAVLFDDGQWPDNTWFEVSALALEESVGGELPRVSLKGFLDYLGAVADQDREVRYKDHLKHIASGNIALVLKKGELHLDLSDSQPVGSVPIKALAAVEGHFQVYRTRVRYDRAKIEKRAEFVRKKLAFAVTHGNAL